MVRGEAPAVGASRRVIFAVVSIALFMASVDQTIVATALPTLDRSLGATINWGSWTVTAYQLGQVVAMPVAGRVSDLWGRKRVFVAAAIVFTVASLLCGLANSIYLLVALRLVQALGGGAFMPSATGIIADAYGADRDRAIGMFTSIFPLGGLAGPVLGGVIVSYMGWRGVFFINVPLGVGFTLLSLVVLPASRRKDTEVDLIGAGQFGLLVGALLYGITNLGDGHIEAWSPRLVVPFCAFVLLSVWFVSRSRHVPAPIIPLRLLHGRGFVVMNVINLVFGACAIGIIALVPLYAEDRYRLTPLQAGTLLTARAVGMILVAAGTSFLLRRIGYRLPMLVGFCIVAAGLVLTTVRPVVLGSYGWLAFGTTVTGLGIGIASPASNNAMLELALGDAAALAGLRGMFRQAGAIIGVSLTTAMLARGGDQAAELTRAFVLLAGSLVAMVPLVFIIPGIRRTRVGEPTRSALNRT